MVTFGASAVGYDGTASSAVDIVEAAGVGLDNLSTTADGYAAESDAVTGSDL